MREPARTLVADPPWQPGDTLPGKARGAAKHYDTLSVLDICEFPLPPLADDCRLFLWRLSSMPQEALDVVYHWGFEPKCELVWRKRTSLDNRHFGMGRTLRNEHETCIIADRGKPERLSKSVRSIFDGPVREHSRKPEEFYRIVEQLSPGPFVELFARRRRVGWTCYGNELQGAA